MLAKSLIAPEFLIWHFHNIIIVSLEIEVISEEQTLKHYFFFLYQKRIFNISLYFIITSQTGMKNTIL